MTQPNVPCPKCGMHYAAHEMRAEETAIIVDTNEIPGVTRCFVATCSVHGNFLAWINGHHSTLSEGYMRRQFSKSEWKTVRQKLGPDDAKQFKAALGGRYYPTDEDIARWQAALPDS